MESFPLTPTQLGMLVDLLRAEIAGAYHEQIAVELHEELEPVALSRAWAQVVAAHGALRTSFVVPDDDAPRQVVHDRATLPLREVDLRALRPEARVRRLEALRAEDIAEPFDLARAPLARLRLARLEAREWCLLWSFPHLVLDGRSFALVLGDVFRAYDAMLAGEMPPAPRPPAFRAFVTWLGTCDARADEQFWRHALARARTSTPLPIPPAAGTPGARGATEAASRMPVAATDALRTAANSAGVGLSTLVYGAWALVLARHARAADVTFGIARAGRRGVPGGDAMVGVLLNTVPLHVVVRPDLRVADWLRELRGVQRALALHEHAPLAAMQRWAGLAPGEALFESVVVFDEGSLDELVRRQRGMWETRRFTLHERTAYPLTLYVYGDPALDIRVGLHERRGARADAERVAAEVVAMIDGLARCLDAPLAALLAPDATHALPSINADRASLA